MSAERAPQERRPVAGVIGGVVGLAIWAGATKLGVDIGQELAAQLESTEGWWDKADYIGRMVLPTAVVSSVGLGLGVWAAGDIHNHQVPFIGTLRMMGPPGKDKS